MRTGRKGSIGHAVATACQTDSATCRQTKSSSVGVLPGTPPSSLSFQPRKARAAFSDGSPANNSPLRRFAFLHPTAQRPPLGRLRSVFAWFDFITVVTLMAGRKTFRFPEACLPVETLITWILTDFAQNSALPTSLFGVHPRLQTLDSGLQPHICPCGWLYRHSNPMLRWVSRCSANACSSGPPLLSCSRTTRTALRMLPRPRSPRTSPLQRRLRRLRQLPARG